MTETRPKTTSSIELHYLSPEESMSRKVILAVIVLMCSCAYAQDWAKAKLEKSPRHGEWVTIKHDGRNVETFVVYPQSKTKTGVVILIHEIFGLSDWAQLEADEVAEAGYIAIAPDLLSGAGPNGGRTKDFPAMKDVTEAIGKLSPEQITADLNAVADYAKKIPSANGKLFVAGFCWGGGQTFRFATNRQDLTAAFSFYGPPPDKESMARIKAPIYGFYAGNDQRIGAMIPDAVTNMKAAGKTFEPVTYDGAGHGFMRAGDAPETAPDDPAKKDAAHTAYVANVKARNEAWDRWKKLMAGAK
jgi:carboxymethylenebutenolidase